MIFGVFDGVHEGHRHFFRETKELGGYLIAVVAPDEVVKILKDRRPNRNVAERIAHIEMQDDVDGAVAGDLEMGSWDIVKKLRPDVVAVGYDQKNLKESLENSLSDFDWPLEIETISAYKPEKYHNSIIKNSH